MTLTQKLLTTSNAYCGLSRLSQSRVSTLIFGDGMRLSGIANGKDLNTRSFERAMAWFVANWPKGSPWPDDVERPCCCPKNPEVTQ